MNYLVDRIMASRAKNPDVKRHMNNACRKANDIVYSYSCFNTDYAGMGTTLVAAAIIGNNAVIANVGDSRAYVISRKKIVQLTKDHSYVQALIEEGRLTEEEAVTHPYRNLITRAVGAEETLLGDSVSLSWQTGDRLLLCTDGLTAMMGEKEICEILSENMSLGVAVHELISAANYHGGEDNITVIVLENTKESTFDA
jgi:protein phosphatase